MWHLRPAVLVVVGVLTVPPAAGATTILVPSQQPTIQQGLDAASAGDTVLVAPASYTGALNRDLDFACKSLVLASEGGAGVTTIDCESAGRGFLFHSCEDTTSVVRGFTIAAAAADTGAGAYCVNGSDPLFEDCVFSNCTAGETGGGLCCDASSPIVRGCTFTGNVAGAPGRRYGYGGGVSCLSGSSPLIADTELIANSAYGSGGLYPYHSSPQVLRSAFLNNTTDLYGNGAGAGFSSSNGAAFTECEFRGNGVETCVGGGMYVSSSAVTITDSDFIDNVSGASGGIHFAYGAGSTVSGCTFVGNYGAWFAAGGIQFVYGGAAVVSNCTFVGNGNNQVWCDDSSPTLEYCIFAFSSAGLPVFCEVGTETPDINHCFVFGNAAGDSLCGGNYSDIVYDDPLLCDLVGGDVTLCADSPCLPGVTWASLVGAEGEGCAACGSPVERRSWGRIKAGYR